MNLLVNGEPTTVPDDATVAQLVAALGRDGKGLAVAVNEAVVPRSTWSAHALAPGDRVEVLAAAQGG